MLHVALLSLFHSAVYPRNVPEHFQHGVVCELEQGSIFREISTAHLPAQDLVAFQDHCLYGCEVNQSSDIAGSGTQRLTSL